MRCLTSLSPNFLIHRTWKIRLFLTSHQNKWLLHVTQGLTFSSYSSLPFVSQLPISMSAILISLSWGPSLLQGMMGNAYMKIAVWNVWSWWSSFFAGFVVFDFRIYFLKPLVKVSSKNKTQFKLDLLLLSSQLQAEKKSYRSSRSYFLKPLVQKAQPGPHQDGTSYPTGEHLGLVLTKPQGPHQGCSMQRWLLQKPMADPEKTDSWQTGGRPFIMQESLKFRCGPGKRRLKLVAGDIPNLLKVQKGWQSHIHHTPKPSNSEPILSTQGR